jgi:alanyl-tRNA synthetase
MKTDEIRSKFLEFFSERDHLRLASGSLVPAQHDPSVLLTTAGMHPLKPYFQGRETPPHHRLTTCQKCFRTPDIDSVGVTKRHLTFFEMLGNFSMGDYFKQGSVEFAWELSLQGFGFEPEKIWITVHEGDEALGLGPDEEAIEAWLSVGVPRERIVLLPSSENFWQAGPIGPCGPCSELYLDRGLGFGAEDDLPGGENERFLEYWNLVFMQFDQDPVGTLTPLPKQNIDTGLGLNRMAAIMQDVDSVFETDQFVPLIELGEELSGKRYGEDFETDRAMRILADHTRGMSFLIADGVVPSNEDRGYVLRKVMRRAIHQGRRIGIEGDFLGRFGERVRELMGPEYPELHEQREAIEMWLRTEEESFGRTIERGLKMLEEMVERAREEGAEGIGGENAFRLHDTFGFPIELTTEIAAERGLGVDQQGFEDLMEQQRRGSHATAGRGAKDELRERAMALSGHSEFVGYETLERETEVVATERMNGHVLVKLEESPFYAEGGGQVSDAGDVDGAPVAGVLRVGDDQVLLLDRELQPGTRVVARVDPAHRRPTECNHTATHLLHAALRERLGGHVRQAGSYVGPDKLRFDFTHGAPLEHVDVQWVEDRVNEQILRNQPVRAITTTLEEAKSLGAMALFGEKYGDVVRMVEIGDGNWSRELCGGTHVRGTAEIGTLRILSESSSAANVRRIEAVTGPVAVDLLRRHDSLLRTTAALLRGAPEDVPDRVQDLRTKVKELEKQLKEGAPAAAAVDPGAAVEVAGVKVLVATADGADPKSLPDLADRLKGQLGNDAVVVLGVAGDGKVSLIVSCTPAAVERGLKAGDLVKLAAGVVGGGGGGRPTMAQAGGRDPSKLPDALAAARAEIERILAG